MRFKYAIGIDAGKTTGVALFEIETGSYLDFYSTTFWRCFWHDWDGFDINPETTMYLIETPRKGFVYASHGGKKLPMGVQQNIAFKAGENNREATLLVEGYRELGYTVETWTPRTKKWKNAEEMNKYVETDERTNEHVRDAIKIIWERFVRDG